MLRRKRLADRLGSNRPQDATSPEEQRRRFLASADFERAVTAHFERAAKLAVADHHGAGRPVHGTVDGRLDRVPPPARPGKRASSR